MGSYCCHAKHNSVNTQEGDKVDDANNIYIKTRAEASPYKKLKTEVISFKCGLKDLELRQTKFYKEKIGMSPSDLVKTRKIYNELGQYPFDGEDYIEDFGEDIAKNPKGRNWIYIGQFKAGTKIASGIGICVWDTGAIFEGYYKNNVLNGPGRYIYPDGNYYIGEFKDGVKHGRGEYHWANGDVYVGTYSGGLKNGCGVLTSKNGTKKSGLWINDIYQEYPLLIPQ